MKVCVKKKRKYVWIPSQNTKKYDAVTYEKNNHSQAAFNQGLWDWNIQNNTGIFALVKTALKGKGLH